MVGQTRWTGRDARLLRVALRLSQRAFAARLGLGERTVSKWEQGGQWTTPRPENQAVLDTALARAGADVQVRFRELVSGSSSSPVAVGLPVPDMGDDQADELAWHLLEQWHLLVKTDNLLGPRYALGSVLKHLQLVKDVLDTTLPRGARPTFVRLAARFAESAAWLAEDGGNLAEAQMHNRDAMAWAHEAGDEQLQAWTLFRASQLAAHNGNPEAMLALCRAAGRHEPALTAPMRGALAQQQAQGHACDGDAKQAQELFDRAHQWASTDSAGDARGGHGSFCTQLHRATAGSQPHPARPTQGGCGPLRPDLAEPACLLPARPWHRPEPPGYRASPRRQP